MKKEAYNSKHEGGIKQMAWLLIFIFSSEIILPNFAKAGGPSQPEVAGFTPIGVSDMVDPFTGDFTYNLPLMNIEGYPINIAYNAGIGMDQEASWVGLGWNLNVGSVVRSLRGLPDDFNGDLIGKESNTKPNRTYTVNGKLDVELFGAGAEIPAGTATGGLNASLAINYNNYNGYGVDFAFGPSFSLAESSGHAMTAGFSLSGSSENGASFSPTLSLQTSLDRTTKSESNLSATIGSTLNSRGGLTEISYGAKAKIDYGAGRSSTKKANSSYNCGLATYSPSSGPSMKNASVNGSFKFGLDVFGLDGVLSLGLGFSSQWIPDDQKSITNPAFGYFNLESGQNKEDALLDFNRDNDGSFTKETPYLPTAQLTYDIFSLNAQGISGSYRGFRNEIGYVFDPAVKTTTTNGDIGVELGGGQLAKLGFDISLYRSVSKSGGWDGNLNYAADHSYFDYNHFGFAKNYSMQEANEKSVDVDNLFDSNIGGDSPVAFELDGSLKWMNLQNKLMYKKGSVAMTNPTYVRQHPIKRNQLMQFLTHHDLANGLGVNELHPSIYSGAKGHHIGEVIQTGTDGRRYVFGIAAYNHLQEDVTFAIGKRINGDPGLSTTDEYNGLIDYGSASPTIATKENDFGIDNYFNAATTPAYAHSFLLTSVLSDDYIDSDNEKGPSINDFGTYVKFDYEKIDNYSWRTPVAAYSAYRNEGMKTDPTDDKASYVYGEKDLWYVKAIETKNYVAVFTLDVREDGRAVDGKNGGVFNSLNPSMQRLMKISLYSRVEYELAGLSATPIQEVHFDYSYELCAGFPGNYNGGGKLTLKEIYFTYQGSNRMKHSPYRFQYSSTNPNYNMKAVDRWGNYKPTSSGIETPIDNGSEMNNADFPYTSQNPNETNVWAEAWSLTRIHLPSGGVIKVEYESDDYAYVQHKKAMRMFKIVSTQEKIDNPAESINVFGVHSVSNSSDKNKRIYFKLDPGHEDLSEYATVGSYLYFRCLTEFMEDLGDNHKNKYEYVSGYGKVDSVGFKIKQGEKLGWIKFKGQALTDGGTEEYSPIAKSAIQFGRLHLSKFINDVGVNDPSDNNSEQGILDFGQAVINSIASLGELFTTPNMSIYNRDRGRRIVTNKSWVRLIEPDGCKLGGGLRVKKIIMEDNWNAMTGMGDFQYGQEYFYKTEDGKSSGVATYEPQIGGDENPWKQPVAYSNKLRFSPDQNLYQEEPIAESLFPSPSVGYSRVTIKDLTREGVSRTATGKVIKEFFTAKDFPTIVAASEKLMKSANSFLPYLPKYQYLGVSQGFTIELNDMHGKPKKEAVYAENVDQPISTVEYFYKKQTLNSAENTFKLTNDVKVINSNGTVTTAEIGVRNEAVADFRKSTTSSVGGAMGFNVNTILFGVIPVPIPTAFPSVSATDNEFKSATMTKIINRFGIMDSTIANQDGSIVKTENLGYDANTGEILSTRTTTNFNDKVYSMNYPAYWKYDQLGQGYKNLDFTRTEVDFNNAGFALITNAANLFVEGDELKIEPKDMISFTPFRAWIERVSTSGINVIDKNGNPITNTNTKITVIRSGRRNKQTTSMASLTTLTDIMPGLTSNTYKNVLNAGAVEFSQDWKTYCQCNNGTLQKPTTNPYILGLKGNLRPVKSYTHLTNRSQSNYNLNTNIRRDGVFTSYTPFYKMEAGKWKVDGRNWTFVSEVTQFSPNGMTLETRDALGRYSASLYSFNNTLTTAVAANASLKQVASASFEDILFQSCSDPLYLSNKDHLTPAAAHTGRVSLAVDNEHPMQFFIEDNSCRQKTCALKLGQVGNDYYINNGSAPYQIDADLINGNVDVSIDATGKITLSGDLSQFEVILNITDSKGCNLVYNLNNTNHTH